MDEDKVLNNQKIINVNIEDEMKKSYIDYAMSVIVARALPDVRDGLKPVHRRILYVMNELSLWPEKAYRKCASIVGDALGKYHPHGDASVYDALVRLAQDFSLRYPLVNGHGNFGSVDGDPAAAYRYTEAKLQKMTMEMLEDIDKNTVDFAPNFDGRLEEPTVLPSKLPNLLINGSYGIAVGMASNIPPHNLTEVVNGLIKMIDNDNLTDDELFAEIKGPDFPTGGIILGKSEIRRAYETGRGKLTLRGVAEIVEAANGRFSIIITEIPYQLNKSYLIEHIAKLVQDKVIEGISELRDESDRDGMRIVIELKRDANANVILNLLYKNTQLQSTASMIMLALVNNEPKVLPLRDILNHFLNHRKDVIQRRTRFDLDKAEARAHILAGLKIALDHIDEVISIIRNSSNDEEAKTTLMTKFALSEIQSQAILDMRLKSLTGLSRDKIEKEFDELMKLIAYLKDVLANEHLVFTIIKDDLIEIKNKYGDERRTQITHSEGEINIEDLIKEETSVVALTQAGYIKRMPADVYKSQRRGGKGVTGINTREEDFVKELFVTSTHNYIMFFTNKGRVYRLKAYEIPESGRQAKGMAIVNLLQLSADEKVSAVIPVSEYTDTKYLLMATKKGLIKKTGLMEYNNIRKTGIQGINLREEDELIDVRLTDGERDIVMVTHNGMSIRFNEQDVRAVGRASMGVKGITLGSKDDVVGMEIVYDNNAYILAITENGFGKRTELDEYRAQNRGGKGILTYKVTAKTSKIVGIKLVTNDDDIMLITIAGIIIRLNVSEISILGRNTQGVTLMRTSDGGKVISITKLIKEDEEEAILDGSDQPQT